MKPSQLLANNRAAIREIVAANRCLNPRIFGSVLHGDDTEDSDLDLLVDTTPETSLLDIAKIQNRIQRLLGCQIDVLTPNAISEKFRANVIAEAVSV
jgi:predicted nucleotidyltransferase